MSYDNKLTKKIPIGNIIINFSMFIFVKVAFCLLLEYYRCIKTGIIRKNSYICSFLFQIYHYARILHTGYYE